MMKMEVTRISVFKTWRIIMLVYGVGYCLLAMAGLVVGIIFTSAGGGIDVLASPIMLVQFVVTSLLILFACFIYNILAPSVGGMEVSIRTDEKNHSL